MAHWIILLILGGAVIAFGGIFFVWAYLERRSDIDTLAHNETNQDVKDLLDEGRISMGPKSLRVGGWLAVLVGVFLLILGIVFRAIA
jgi:hypothetical protein